MLLLDWTLIFLVLALIAGGFGFGGVAQESAKIAKILFVIFLVLYVLAFFFKGKINFRMRSDDGKVNIEMKNKR